MTRTKTRTQARLQMLVSRCIHSSCQMLSMKAPYYPKVTRVSYQRSDLIKPSKTIVVVGFLVIDSKLDSNFKSLQVFRSICHLQQLCSNSRSAARLFRFRVVPRPSQSFLESTRSREWPSGSFHL